MSNSVISTLLTAPIRAYKFFLSPWLGQSCKFTPTCSSYAIEAIETLGPGRGLWLSAKRIGRCNPWCQGGHDPVPKNDLSESKDLARSSRCHTD